ncbi:MAG: alpha/beta hydrolase [Candidatus Nealsonbacteria bacterium]
METILILHGWGIGSKTWARVKKELEWRGCEVFVPDLPGFGGNPAPERPWAIDDYADWVKDYCDKNNLSQVFLLGHSFGGGIAVKFINRYPEKIKRLILVAPALVREKTYKYYIALALAKAGKLFFSVPGLSYFQPLARKILYSLLGSKDYYKLETEKTLMMKDTFKKVISEDLRPFLKNIKVPTLLIWGKKDNMTPFKYTNLINREISTLRFEAVANGEHILNLQNPELLVEKVVKFIRS